MATKKVAKTTTKRKLRLGEGDPVLASYLDDISDSTPLAATDEAELDGQVCVPFLYSEKFEDIL